MIGIITYDFPHRKTQNLISNLLIKGYKDLLVIATPFVERKNFQPLFNHRPNKTIDIAVDDLCKNLNIQCIKIDQSQLSAYLKKNELEYILIAGAGILHEDIAKNFKVINSHPGYLPNVKGLDAFKWAIFSGQPIGVTTHFISEKADEGLLIEKRIVPVYFEDTFHSVSYRQYEMEVEMLVNAIEISKKLKGHEELIDDRFKANRRMPHHLELKMMKIFDTLIESSPSIIQSNLP